MKDRHDFSKGERGKFYRPDAEFHLPVDARRVSISEIKAGFSRIIDEVGKGTSFVVVKRGKPVALLTPVQQRKRNKFRFGTMKGKIKFAPDFDAPLPDDLLASFEGEDSA